MANDSRGWQEGTLTGVTRVLRGLPHTWTHDRTSHECCQPPETGRVTCPRRKSLPLVWPRSLHRHLVATNPPTLDEQAAAHAVAACASGPLLGLLFRRRRSCSDFAMRFALPCPNTYRAD